MPLVKTSTAPDDARPDPPLLRALPWLALLATSYNALTALALGLLADHRQLARLPRAVACLLLSIVLLAALESTGAGRADEEEEEAD